MSATSKGSGSKEPVRKKDKERAQVCGLESSGVVGIGNAPKTLAIIPVTRGVAPDEQQLMNVQLLTQIYKNARLKPQDIDALLVKKAEINYQSRNGTSPLLLACSLPRPEATKNRHLVVALLERRAEPNLPLRPQREDDQSDTSAAQEKQSVVWREKWDNKTDHIRKKAFEMKTWSNDKIGDVKGPWSDKRPVLTPENALMKAGLKGPMTSWIQTELALAGKDDYDGPRDTPRPGDVGSMLLTPLHVAAVKGENDTCALLLEKGADVNAPDGRGRTPLVSVLQQVLDPSLRPQPRVSGFAKGPHGKLGRPAPAEGGVDDKMSSVMEVLMSHKGLPHTPDAPTTPLHDAAQRADIQWIRLLLGFGADVNIRDWRQKTPLDLAIDEKQLRPQVPGPKPKEGDDLNFVEALNETCRILEAARTVSKDDGPGTPRSADAIDGDATASSFQDVLEADSPKAEADPNTTLYPVQEEQ